MKEMDDFIANPGVGFILILCFILLYFDIIIHLKQIFLISVQENHWNTYPKIGKIRVKLEKENEDEEQQYLQYDSPSKFEKKENGDDKKRLINELLSFRNVIRTRHDKEIVRGIRARISGLTAETPRDV